MNLVDKDFSLERLFQVINIKIKTIMIDIIKNKNF